jgi:hypothetical protein
VVAHDLAAVAIVEQPLGESHAHGIAEPLPQRAGGGLDARAWPYSGWPGVREPSWRSA